MQEAEDNYYITAKYLLELANRAYDLFVSSEVTERRQLIKLVLSNLRVEGKKVQYDALKPFDEIINCSDRQLWLASSPDILFQIFSGEKLVQVKEQLKDLERILKIKPSYEVIKVKNGKILKLN